MLIKHRTVDCFFVLCGNAAILSFIFILTKYQTKGNYSTPQLTRSLKGNEKLLELAEFRVIGVEFNFPG